MTRKPKKRGKMNPLEGKSVEGSQKKVEASQKSAAISETLNNEKQSTRRAFLRRSLKVGAGLMGASLLKMTYDAASKDEIAPPAKPKTLESLPEDPKRLFILDESWREYAQQESQSLSQLAPLLFTVLHEANTLLLEYYPPLAEDKKIRIRYLSNDHVQNQEGFSFHGHYSENFDTSIETTKEGKSMPVYSRKPGEGILELPNLSEDSLSSIVHELSHAYNSNAGLHASRILNEGLATFMEKTLNPRLKRKEIKDPIYDEILEAFPELLQMPMNAPFVITENLRDWAQLGEIYYRQAWAILQAWEDQHPGFIKKWINELNTSNYSKEFSTNKTLSMEEIMQAGERIQAGFYQYLNNHPNMQVFGSESFEYFLVRVSNGKLFGMNICSGVREADLQNGYACQFPDILPALPKEISFHDKEGRIIGGMTITKTLQVESLENLERLAGQKISSIGFHTPDGKQHLVRTGL